jgi:hypothetical protein
MYTVYGDVIGGSGYSVHVVTDEGFDHTAPVDTQGRYRVDIPRSYVPSFTPMDESNNSFGQYIRSRIELGMSIRLLDSNGAALSGIRMIPFYQQGCSGYYEFSRFEAGRRFGRPVEVTGLDVVNPIYQIMTTEVTSIPNSLMIGEAPHYLDCNFVGLIGRAYAQGVTVDEINVYANSLTDDEEGIHYYTDYTGSFARSMLLPVFSGMWVLSLPKNDQYYVQFMYTPPEYDMHDLGGVVVDIPEETDCQQHVILMSLIPMEILDVPPYRL